MTATVQIFVYMPDEAVDTWRPVEASSLPLESIGSCHPTPIRTAKYGNFRSGELVRCEERAFQGGQIGLVGTGRAEPSN